MVNERAYAKKKKEQMLLLKIVFTFQLSLQTDLPFPLKKIFLRKISCKVSGWCPVAHFPHPCFDLLSSSKAFWGAKSSRNIMCMGYYMANVDLLLSHCHETTGRDVAGWGPLVQLAPGCALRSQHRQWQPLGHRPQWSSRVLASVLETREGLVFKECYY